MWACLSIPDVAGTMGLVADLTAGEIIEQAVHAFQEAPFRNVVFMGMVCLTKAFLVCKPKDSVFGMSYG